MAAQQHFINVDGPRMHCQDLGQGQPLPLLHGYP
ncbi:hypothetical protein Q668_03485 [Alcanivorax sp. PN-3]|nr:hypothetical protein Q668_03485 [Alcanivorax sp. PN-3]